MKKKKLIISLFLVLILVTAVISISFISFGSPAEEKTPKFETSKTSETIGYSTEYASISIDLLEGWEYKINELDGEYDDFSIQIWPADHKEGKLILQYQEFFGVCGTGLTTKQITLGTYEAWEGIYDNEKVWSFIHFIDTDYSVWNSGAEEWWGDYGDEAMYMLETIKIGGAICIDD